MTPWSHRLDALGVSRYPPVLSDRVADAMLAAIGTTAPGTMKREFTADLEREAMQRGLVFDPCPGHHGFQPCVGASGREIYEVARTGLSASAFPRMAFKAHGMGLIGHEAPRLTAAGPVPYPDGDAGSPLQGGMVALIETTLAHPTRGFIRLEDTVAVTTTGWDAFGDHERGCNQGATA